jgi:hypothetical protein
LATTVLSESTIHVSDARLITFDEAQAEVANSFIQPL